MKDPKIHNIVFIIYFYVYKKNHERIKKTKMTCKIIRERAWNRPDSPEKKKRKKEKKKQKEEIEKRSETNMKMKNESDTVTDRR